jgi:superfamily II DNA or RNA helicase
MVAGVAAYADAIAFALRGAGDATGGPRRTLLTPFDRLLPASQPTRLHVVRPRRWLHAVRRAALRTARFGELVTPHARSFDLLAYQLEPALAVVRDGASRILIADGVGLGKTIQAGLIVAELAAREPDLRAIVLAPAGLRAQWCRELARHYGVHATVADAGWLARRARELPPDVNPWVLPGVYVASYDFVKRPEVLRAIEDLSWDAVVVDEAHNATTGSARLSAVDAIASCARRVVLLTATPHSGDPAKFDSVCAIGCAAARHAPVLMFRRTRRHVAGRARRTALLSVRPTAAERRMHRLLERYGAEVCRESAARGDALARLAVIVLRKRALSSAGSLAVSARRRLELLSGTREDEAAQLRLPLPDEDPLDDDVADGVLAHAGLADGARERRLLERVLHAAEEAARAESKIARLRRLVARVREPLIVFTEYRDTLVRLRDALHALGVRPAFLHGGMSAIERDLVQEQFNQEGGVLLATDAAAEGLNLQARCRAVVHFELPWNPARLEQRTGRVDRIGQLRRVHEIAFVAADTAERLVLAPLMGRVARMERDLPAGGTLAWISESQVAASVMDGIDAPEAVSSVSPGVFVDPPPFSANAAVAEAARLEMLRSWHASRSTRRRRWREAAVPLAHVRARRTTLPSGVIAVSQATLTAASGHAIHSELAAVHVPAATLLGRATAADVRGFVERWLASNGDVMCAKVSEALKRSLEEATAAHERADASCAERERALLARAGSVARELVQAGLFDSRATRERTLRRAADGARVAESERRLTTLSATSPMLAIDLVAVLVVSARNAK